MTYMRKTWANRPLPTPAARKPQRYSFLIAVDPVGSSKAARGFHCQDNFELPCEALQQRIYGRKFQDFAVLAPSNKNQSVT